MCVAKEAVKLWLRYILFFCKNFKFIGTSMRQLIANIYKKIDSYLFKRQNQLFYFAIAVFFLSILYRFYELKFLGENSLASVFSAFATLLGVIAVAIAQYFERRESNSFAKKLIRKLASRVSASDNTKKGLVVSLTYLSSMKRRNSPIKLLLINVAMITTLINVVLFDENIPNPDRLNNFASYTVLSLLFLVLLAAKEKVVEYRIKNGLFGTTRYEAKELIDFLLKNADDIDFTDNDGNAHKIFFPEKSKLEHRESRLAPKGKF